MPSIIVQDTPLDKSPVCVGLASQLSIAAIRLSSTSLRFITDIVQPNPFLHRNEFFVIALPLTNNPSSSYTKVNISMDLTFTNVSPIDYLPSSRCNKRLSRDLLKFEKCNKKKKGGKLSSHASHIIY